MNTRSVAQRRTTRQGYPATGLGQGEPVEPWRERSQEIALCARRAKWRLACAPPEDISHAADRFSAARRDFRDRIPVNKSVG